MKYFLQQLHDALGDRGKALEWRMKENLSALSSSAGNTLVSPTVTGTAAASTVSPCSGCRELKR